MAISEVKYRRPLNSQQIAVLEWLCKFRFSTSKQVTDYLGKADKTTQKKLKVLGDQGYIGKRYDKSYKLQGKPAAYYLTPKGAKQLERAKPQTMNLNAIKSLYKNSTVSEDFIVHCLNVCDTVLKLHALYGNKLKTFTKNQLQQADYLPAWAADLFVSLRRSTDENDRQRYFLDVWDGTKPFFIIVRKVRNYLTYAEEGDWPSAYDFPSILMICENERIQKKLNRQIRKALAESYEDETIFATTTKQTFTESTAKDKIWYNLQANNFDDDEDMQILEQLQAAGSGTGSD